jgi:hypothetical protein
VSIEIWELERVWYEQKEISASEFSLNLEIVHHEQVIDKGTLRPFLIDQKTTGCQNHENILKFFEGVKGQPHFLLPKEVQL